MIGCLEGCDDGMTDGWLLGQLVAIGRRMIALPIAPPAIPIAVLSILMENTGRVLVFAIAVAVDQ